MPPEELQTRIHAPVRVAPHRHRRRRPARQFPAGDPDVCRPVHGTASRNRRPRCAPRRTVGGVSGRPARRRTDYRGQRQTGGQLVRSALGAVQAIVDKRDARASTSRSRRAASSDALAARRRAGRTGRGRRFAGHAGPGTGASQSRARARCVAGGPAQRAGLRSGDLIVSVNGKPVVDGHRLDRGGARLAGRAAALSTSCAAAQPLHAAVTPRTRTTDGQGVGDPGRSCSMAPEMVTVSAGPLEALCARRSSRPGTPAC